MSNTKHFTCECPDCNSVGVITVQWEASSCSFIDYQCPECNRSWTVAE